jgi:hypothetical protein
MSNSEPPVQKAKQRRRSRTDILLVFDPAQRVPDALLDAILEEWLVLCLVDELLRERRPSMGSRCSGGHHSITP